MRRIGLGFAVFLMFCSVGAHAAGEEKKVLHWVGDEDTANAVVRPLAAEYERRKKVKIDIDVKTSTRGIRSVLIGQADLGGTGRYIIEGLPEEMGVNLHPIAWDAMVVLVHPDNPLGNLSLDDVAKIVSGEISNWQELGGPDKPVHLYLHEDPLSGVDYSVLNVLFGYIDVDTEHAMLLADAVSSRDAVAQDPLGIGFFGMESVGESAVKSLAIDGVEPDMQSLKSGRYPLFRTLYMVVPPEHQNLSMIRDFVRFAESAVARSSIRDAGAMPYREAVNLVVKGMRLQRERISRQQKTAE